MARVFGALAGRDMPSDLMGTWARSAELVIAADAGADVLYEAGISPQVIVGDLDSIVDTDRFPNAVIHRLEDQDFTDCDKLLSVAKQMGYESLTLGGLEGDRMDHALASWLSIARSGLDVRVALRRGLGWVVRAGAELRVPSDVGATVSLLPLADCTGVTFQSVHWPLERARLAWDGLVSISNKAEGLEVVASIESGVAILIVECPRASMPWW